jgi:hydrogenase maturation factor
VVGKLCPKLLGRYVLSRIGVRDPLVVGPGIGDGRVLVTHVDTITGAVKRLGWLAVHIACNDVAVRSAKPRWLLPTLLLLEDVAEELVDKVAVRIDEAAREVGAVVVDGCTEFTPGLGRPLISTTAIGVADRGRVATIHSVLEQGTWL